MSRIATPLAAAASGQAGLLALKAAEVVKRAELALETDAVLHQRKTLATLQRALLHPKFRIAVAGVIGESARRPVAAACRLEAVAAPLAAATLQSLRCVIKGRVCPRNQKCLSWQRMLQ